MASTTPYERLVDAASSMTGTEILEDWDEAEIADVQAFLENNHDAFGSARAALSAKCSVPVKYEFSFSREHADDSEHLRNLARAFAMELRHAHCNGNLASAVRIGVDILELANAARRGGLVFDSLMSGVILGIALEHLRIVRAQLGESHRIALIRDLDRIEREQEPLVDIVQRDRQWEIAVGYEEEPIDFTKYELENLADCGLPEDAQRLLSEWVQSIADLSEEEHQSLRADIDKRGTSLIRMLSVDLAIRSYYATRSSYPDSLASLVPDILATPLLDPFTDQPFLYRRDSADSFVLYSTGPDRIDHGGVFGPWRTVADGAADLCLDANDYDT